MLCMQVQYVMVIIKPSRLVSGLDDTLQVCELHLEPLAMVPTNSDLIQRVRANHCGSLSPWATYRGISCILCMVKFNIQTLRIEKFARSSVTGSLFFCIFHLLYKWPRIRHQAELRWSSGTTETHHSSEDSPQEPPPTLSNWKNGRERFWQRACFTLGDGGWSSSSLHCRILPTNPRC
jgi:hypothetical protein